MNNWIEKIWWAMLITPSHSPVLCLSPAGAAGRSNYGQIFPPSWSGQTGAPGPRAGWEAPGMPPVWPERNVRSLSWGNSHLIISLMRRWSTSLVLFLSKYPLCFTISLINSSSSSLITGLGGGWGRIWPIMESPTWMFLLWVRGWRASLFLQWTSSIST